MTAMRKPITNRLQSISFKTDNFLHEHTDLDWPSFKQPVSGSRISKHLINWNMQESIRDRFVGDENAC